MTILQFAKEFWGKYQTQTPLGITVKQCWMIVLADVGFKGVQTITTCGQCYFYGNTEGNTPGGQIPGGAKSLRHRVLVVFIF